MCKFDECTSLIREPFGVYPMLTCLHFKLVFREFLSNAQVWPDVTTQPQVPRVDDLDRFKRDGASAGPCFDDSGAIVLDWKNSLAKSEWNQQALLLLTTAFIAHLRKIDKSGDIGVKLDNYNPEVIKDKIEEKLRSRQIFYKPNEEVRAKQRTATRRYSRRKTVRSE